MTTNSTRSEEDLATALGEGERRARGPTLLYVEHGREIGPDAGGWPDGLPLVRIDARTYRRPTGAELAELHRRYPDSVRSTMRPALGRGGDDGP